MPIIHFVSEKLSEFNLGVTFKHRRALATHRSGGLCIIYKKEISNHISFIENSCELVQWVKISKDILSLDRDVVLGNTYIPPQHSRYHNPTPFQDLQEEIHNFEDNYICIAGDFNSHTRTSRDYVIRNDFAPEQLKFDEDAQNGLDNLNLLINYNISPDRQNIDTRPINNYGILLLKFGKCKNFLIANGQLG